MHKTHSIILASNATIKDLFFIDNIICMKIVYYYYNDSYYRGFNITDIPFDKNNTTYLCYGYWDIIKGEVKSTNTWVDYEEPKEPKEPNEFYGNFKTLYNLINQGYSICVNMVIRPFDINDDMNKIILNMINVFRKYPIFSGVTFIINEFIPEGHLEDNYPYYADNQNKSYIIREDNVDKLKTFLMKLRKALCANGMSHSSINISTYYLSKSTIQKISPYVNEFHIKTYDFYDGHYQNNNITRFHTNPRKSQFNKYSCEEIMDSYLSYNIMGSKLFMGIATHSRGFSNTKGIGENAYKGYEGGTCEYGKISYKYLPLAGSIEYNDVESNAAYCYDSEKQLFNSYDNPKSTIEKWMIAKEKKLGGLFICDISEDKQINDPRSLVKIIKELALRTYN